MTVLKYYPNKISGKNHIFKNKNDVTALCGMSGYPSSWGFDPEVLKTKNTCKNCSKLYGTKRPSVPQ